MAVPRKPAPCMPRSRPPTPALLLCCPLSPPYSAGFPGEGRWPQGHPDRDHNMA